MINKIEMPPARSMSKGERIAFKNSGAHPAYRETKKSDGTYLSALELQEEMVDWIVDHIYGGASDDADNGALSKLADDTYRKTYGFKMEEQEKN